MGTAPWWTPWVVSVTVIPVCVVALAVIFWAWDTWVRR
jgi:hypothetical protein